MKAFRVQTMWDMYYVFSDNIENAEAEFNKQHENDECVIINEIKKKFIFKIN